MNQMGSRSHMRRGNFGQVEGAACCNVYGLPAMSCAKTAEPIEILFVMVSRVDPRSHALDGSPDFPLRRSNFEGQDML